MAEHHGSPAAWTAVILVIAGFLVGAAGLMAGQIRGLYVGAGLVVVGGIAGKLLQLMGLGQERTP
jgi:hypothetical protein